MYISEAHGSESKRSGEAENKCGGTEKRQERRIKNKNKREIAPAGRSKEIPLLSYQWIDISHRVSSLFSRLACIKLQ